MRIAFVLPGLHRVHRGAEAAFESLAREIGSHADYDVTLIGSGEAYPDSPYAFIHADMVPRETFRRWPSIPPFRTEYRYEEFTFMRKMRKVYDPDAYDITITCSYPFVQWALRSKKKNGRRPLQVFVTENGDWAARRVNMEYRWFDCEGLVCTNPDYFRRHRESYRSVLIPNGIDVSFFCPGEDRRDELELPQGKPLILMVSALIPSKHPLDGVRAAAALPGSALVIAGDGPLHKECDALGKSLLGDRYKRITLPPEKMPDLYRSADLLVHLSREEAFGNIYIEAAACGLPVVAHDYETPRWILDSTGIFADTSQQNNTVMALQNASERKARLDVAAQHKRLSERFSWPVVAKQYMNFLSELMG